MTYAEYRALEAVNISSLLHLAKSPLHYRHALEHGGKESAALTAGRLVHMAVLEPDRYAAEVAIWDGAVRRGKAWDQWQLDNAGKVHATESEHELCMGISESVRSHPAASRYLSSKDAVTESTIRWRHPIGIDCKGRTDWMDLGSNTIMDLKTSRDASEFEFGRSAAKYAYAARAAFYADGFKTCYGELPSFVLVAVEKDPPYAVAVYRVPEFVIDSGRRAYEKLLGRLKNCRDNDRWPGIAGDMETDLVLPEWAFGADDELELVIGGEHVGV